LQPTTETEAMVTYIVNTNTKKFHKPSCSSVSDIKESNRWDFTGTREELIEKGYVPCKKCNP
jgi:DNA-entry nuclease